MSNYDYGIYTKEMIWDATNRGLLTRKEYKNIIGEEFVPKQ